MPRTRAFSVRSDNLAIRGRKMRTQHRVTTKHVTPRSPPGRTKKTGISPLQALPLTKWFLNIRSATQLERHRRSYSRLSNEHQCLS